MTDKLGEEFIKAAREFSDTRIMNTINQPFNYSKEKFEAAKVVALERKLLTEDDFSEDGEVDLYGDSKKMLQAGKTVESIMSYMVGKGVSEKEAISSIYEVAKEVKLKNSSFEEEEENAAKKWIGVFVVIIVVQLFLAS